MNDDDWIAGPPSKWAHSEIQFPVSRDFFYPTATCLQISRYATTRADQPYESHAAIIRATVNIIGCQTVAA